MLHHPQVAHAIDPVELLASTGPRVDDGEFALLGEVQTLYHAKRALKRICEANGLSAFALLRLKTDGPMLSIEMVTSSWPEGLPERLKVMADQDLRFRTRLLDGVVPFHVDLGTNADGLAAAAICLPVFCERARGAVLFELLGDLPSEAAFRQIHLYALYLFANLTALMKPRSALTPLAPRETECLRWSAAGKTSSEIAGIIGVSENTVNSYLSSAAQKMNAVNRVQTVAQAIRLGLLS
ncbi:MAG: helix-turn-helix domain-containing protein [Rhizobiaceae bacterium]|nr:helix-turn-helix domain-containing protein [Rhizobiaceae bacterium]